jgi:OOP family OmpA-OmpF porin
MKKLIVALIASAAAVGAAQAQQQNTAPRAYIGAGAAIVDHEYKIPGASSLGHSEYKSSGKLFGGYDFNQNWGVEAGYTDYRTSNASYTVNGVQGSAEADGYSFYLAGKATLPVNERFSVYGKLGAAYNKVDLSSTMPLRHDESDTEVYGGVGVQYNLNQNVSLIAEYERYGSSRDFGPKPDVFTVGAKYSF